MKRAFTGMKIKERRPEFYRPPRFKGKVFYSTATTSTSTRTFLGRLFTATHERAGLPVKYFSYTELNAAKSPISAKKQVVFTAFVKSVPAAFKISFMFFITCSVCTEISPSAIWWQVRHLNFLHNLFIGQNSFIWPGEKIFNANDSLSLWSSQL